MGKGEDYTMSQTDLVFALLTDLEDALSGLPKERRERAAADMARIRALVGERMGSDGRDAPPAEERTLATGEARLRELVESINDGFFALNRDWRFTYLNQRAARNVGYSAAELIGQNIWETFPGVLRTAHEQYYRQVMEQRQPASFEVAGALTDQWYNIRVYPSTNGITIFWIDITEQKRIEKTIQAEQIKLELSEEKFAKVFRSSPIALAISTIEEGRFVEINDTYTTIYGYGREEIIGHTSIELGIITPEDRKEVISKFQAGKGFRNVELKGHAKNGEVRYTLFSTEPIEIGGRGYMLSVIMDITERKRAEEALREHMVRLEIQRRLLEYREQERQMIARDLHDGPIQDLTSMLFNIQFAKEAITDLAIKVELDKIALGLKGVVQNLRGMINEMRPPSLIRFGLAKAIQIYLDDFKEKHPEIVLDVSLMDDGSSLIEQARLSLFRIMQEALNNTTRHSRATEIEVILECGDRQVALEICDKGKGFEVADNLVDYSAAGHYGLVGMKERAEAIGGALEIDTVPEKGTTIRVVVPIEEKK